MNKAKKLLSILLVFSMIFTLFAGTSTVAFGEEEKSAEQVVITALPNFEIGGAVADANIEYEPAEGVNVRTVWQVYDTERDEYTRWFDVKEGVFESGKIYELFIYATIEEGYTYYTEMFSYNGEDLETWFASDEETDEAFSFHSFGRYSDTVELPKIAVTAPEPVVGEVATVKNVVFYDREGNPVDVGEMANCATWQKKVGQEYVDVTGQAFEKDNTYVLVVKVNAEGKGFSLPEYPVMVVNGVENEVGADPFDMEQWTYYTTWDDLASLEVKDLPAFEAGVEITDTASCDVEGIDVYASWGDENDEALEEGAKFEAGKTYNLTLYAYTHPRGIADDFVFIIDGQEYAAEDIDSENGSVTANIKVEIPAEEDAVTEGADDDDEKAPATGDNNMLMAWMALAAVGAAGVMAVRRREN
ncbi:MAG: LPXTG cell wall anchor domain-containing protein [Firmicutes bacterium]|nr:LPXTG cell wall anchor domain-containing protein [Bacillota bacterium]